jgi:hypothetical protein
MTPIETARLGKLIVRLLLLPLVSLGLIAACPLPQATYVLRSSGNDWMRIGPADDGEMILSFTRGARETSVALPQVIDRIQIERMDAKGRHLPPNMDDAPVYIRIQGLAKISDAPDGEWRLAWCAKRASP